MIVRRLKGRMIREHYWVQGRCACSAWQAGYIEGRTDTEDYYLAVPGIGAVLARPSVELDLSKFG